MKELSKLKRGYVICGYARTGSTLLRSALLATNQLGDPQEYFNPLAISVAEGQHYPHDASLQIAEITSRGMTKNGIYGLKIFCDQFDALRGFDWASQLPDLSFVHLSRRDTLAQAISWVRACQSRQWTSDQPFNGKLQYDERAIAAALNKFSYDKARWTSFFARNGIVPLNLVYEDIVDAIPQAVQAIGAMMGVSGLMAPPMQVTPLQVQRDSQSDEWRLRFVASQRAWSVLDKPGPTDSRTWIWRLLNRN